MLKNNPAGQVFRAHPAAAVAVRRLNVSTPASSAYLTSPRARARVRAIRGRQLPRVVAVDYSFRRIQAASAGAAGD